jgi:hypothetical protein
MLTKVASRAVNRGKEFQNQDSFFFMSYHKIRIAEKTGVGTHPRILLGKEKLIYLTQFKEGAENEYIHHKDQKVVPGRGSQRTL